jgi:hypothetical protein
LVFAFLSMEWLPSPSRAAPPTISACDAWKYVGQNVTVEGVVTVVSTTKKGVTLIYLGGHYPTSASPLGFRLGQTWRGIT